MVMSLEGSLTHGDLAQRAFRFFITERSKRIFNSIEKNMISCKFKNTNDLELKKKILPRVLKVPGN